MRASGGSAAKGGHLHAEIRGTLWKDALITYVLRNIAMRIPASGSPVACVDHVRGLTRPEMPEGSGEGC